MNDAHADEGSPVPHADGAADSGPAEEVSSLLGYESADPATEAASLQLEEDCLPVEIVADAVEATARERAGAVRRRSADLARDVLARAEQEVRELLVEGLSETDFAARSAAIVSRADREVRQILAQGRTDAEVVAMRAGQHAAELRAHAASTSFADEPSIEVTTEPGEAPVTEVLVPPQAVVAMSAGQVTADPCFATLRAAPLTTHDGSVAFRVEGSLTLATMVAFQEAVARLPGVSSVSVTPEPGDVATLSLKATDPTRIPALLVCLPGIQLQIGAA